MKRAVIVVGSHHAGKSKTFIEFSWFESPLIAKSGFMMSERVRSCGICAANQKLALGAVESLSAFGCSVATSTHRPQPDEQLSASRLK
jgi:hypothetical protein